MRDWVQVGIDMVKGGFSFAKRADATYLPPLKKADATYTPFFTNAPLFKFCISLFYFSST